MAGQKRIRKPKKPAETGNGAFDMNTGIVFDIKKYAVHDGPGIRTTVFLKGCPLRCWWCHNPEGIAPDPELAFRPERCLENCRACVAACPEHAVARTGGGIEIDAAACRKHGLCAEACPTEALRWIGRKISVEDLMREIEKDRVFYDASGGGATFSGGEPLMQPGFLHGLLKACRDRDIHTVVDTSGYAPFESLERILPLTGLFLFDIKHMDDARHREATGVSNRKILDNLRRLARAGNEVEIRFPVITGFNDGDAHIRALSGFLKDLDGIRTVTLLPYHRIGTQKYGDVRRPHVGPELVPPPDSTIQRIRKLLTEDGFNVKIGG
jgi:pyruvate formate lyase activating enzyme